MGDLSTQDRVDASRRDFLKVSAAAGGGLLLGFHLSARQAGAVAAPATTFAPNAFLRIGADNTVTVIVKHLEMGQGVHTGLPTLVAEELDADWAQIRVESAPADVARYGNLAWGGSAQGTGGSTSLRGSWEQLRKAGAAARTLLVNAAAQQWNVDAKRLKTDKGYVLDAIGKRRASYGELAVRAATLTVPDEVPLKAPKNWRLIGKQAARKDSPAKINGQAQFAGDVRLPGMLTALVARPPRFGAKAKGLNADKVRALPGVKAVVEIPQGVAVVAADFWSARNARNALKVEWDEAGAERRSTETLRREYAELATRAGAVAHRSGDVAQVLAGAGKKLDASFEFPYLAHAPMEPLSCVVRLGENACEVWAGSQLQTLDQAVAAGVAGLKPEQVTIHTLYAGGSFGRHANSTADYIAEAVATAKATRNLKAPIRLLWTREDDIRGGYYRPFYLHRIEAALDKKNMPLAWQHRIVGQSILTGTPFGGMMKDGIDVTSVEGAANLPYAIPHLNVELHTTQVGVPVLWWRSVGSTHTAFSTEVVIDELASAAGKDPVAFRRALLKSHPRHRAVLDLVTSKAGWGRPLPRGRARGVAVHESFGSYVAEVAEITLTSATTFTVDRVVCAVDCGVAVNPDVVRAQMESGILFGLSAALYGAITLKDGEVQQSNFHDHPILRLHEAPRIEVHIVKSSAVPTGVGEPGVPPIAPAVANALRAATGKPVRSLPIRLA
jgi:isoquinoline 1-oxidoreductase beta subunit